MADYDLLKSKRNYTEHAKVTLTFLRSVYMMILLLCLISFSEKERDVVIAMIDITPYMDLIVGNKSHVIRYRE